MSRWKKYISKSEYTLQNRVRLVKGGRDYFDCLVKMIKEAKYSLYLQFYIFLDDETGLMIIESLKQISRRGVAVFLHIDGYASQKLSNKSITELRNAGVKVKWFEPLFRSKHFYFGRRLHHKVVVADGLYSLVGGINVSDRYNDMPGTPAWLDMALYCEGEASYLLYNICRLMWRKKYIPSHLNLESIETYCDQIPENEKVNVRVVRNDWVKRKIQIWKSYQDMLSTAQHNVIIMCSYFLPGRAIRRKINQAVKKGVKIKIILAGRSDVMMAKHAERYLYDWLLKNNIEIYEYQDTVLHAKVATCDCQWVTVGSYNLNNISAYASLEINLEVLNNKFAAKVEDELKTIIELHCKQITLENYTSSTHFVRRIWQRFCYSFINNVLNLFTFYFKQEE